MYGAQEVFVAQPHDDVIGKEGALAREEQRLESLEIQRARELAMVSQDELNSAVAATIYGWGGRTRFPQWDPSYRRAVADAPMGCRLSASLVERPAPGDSSNADASVPD
jgi:hypothetical protein